MNTQKRSIFSPQVGNGQIDDDHVPFLNYGNSKKTDFFFLKTLSSDVPILHLISTPFPPTWHTANDNEANLDFPSITHIRNIMKIFVIEYLHLQQQIC